MRHRNDHPACFKCMHAFDNAERGSAKRGDGTNIIYCWYYGHFIGNHVAMYEYADTAGLCLSFKRDPCYSQEPARRARFVLL